MKNFFRDLPRDLSSEVFENILAHDGLTIERIISKGHRSPDHGWYDQNGFEWVMLLQGLAIIEFDDNTSVRLRPGDYLTIAPHQKHRVSWTDPAQESLWLAVHF